jgi:hypothetical protein
MGADPQTSNVADNNKVAISMGILVAIIAVIVIAVWYTNRIRVPVVVPLSVRNQRRREEELYRKETEHFIVDSLPVFRYSAKLQRRLRKACEAHRANNLETGMLGACSQTSEVESTRKFEDDEAHNSSSEDATTEQSTVKYTEPAQNRTIKQPGETCLLEEMEQNSKDATLTCSVCTEDFVENDTVRILPCGHIYHRRCIDPWLLRFGGNCPLW